MKKCLSLVLVYAMLTTYSLSASASEMSITEGSTTGTTPSGFEVTDDLVGGGVTVTIPANLDLTYNEQYGTFTTHDVVGVRGSIIDTAEVVISLGREVTYTLVSDSSKKVTGYVSFGTTKDGICTETWNSSQVAKGYTDPTLTDTRGIVVNVPTEVVDNIGDYSASVEFDIKLGFLGLYNEICPPTAIDSTYGVYPITSNYGVSKIQGYYWNDSSSVQEAINLCNLTDDPKRPESYKYAMFLQQNNTTYNYLKNVKYIEMFSMNNIMTYSSRPDISYPRYTKSWIYGFTNLKVVVVPNDMTSAQLHASPDNCVGTIDTSGDIYIYDTTNVVFKNTNIAIGNALVFLKGITDDDLFIYVPHIVYRGTRDEWKALSGSTDWVFGNAANVVTVHCLDGNIIY